MSKLSKELENLVSQEVKKNFHETMKISGLVKEQKKPTTSSSVLNQTKKIIKEAVNLIPKAFGLKTDKLSPLAKQDHETLYQGYVNTLNKVSITLDAADRENVNSNSSNYRSLKEDETYNFNAAKLHELFFTNISDLDSRITTDSLPYMHLAKDFGTFEAWQYDFMACALSARNGWAITVYEPYRKKYMNCFIDGHDCKVPVGTIPVIVLDMFEHSYIKDYGINKSLYIKNMMKEFNWNVIEARMIIVESTNLELLYSIQPIVNNQPEKMVTTAAERVPVEPVSNETNEVVPATTPAKPETEVTQ